MDGEKERGEEKKGGERQLIKSSLLSGHHW